MAVVKMSELALDRAELTVNINGCPVQVVYRPEIVTLEKINSLSLGGNDEESARAQEFLAEVIISWNLADDDGNVIPVTVDTLATTSVVVLRPVVNAIGDALMLGEA